MVKTQGQTVRPRPQILVYELSTDPGEVAHLLTPKIFYSEELHKRGVERLGETGYALLRSQVMVAIPQMMRSLELLDAGFMARGAEIAQMPAGDERSRAERDFTQLGRATHWDAITRLGVIVEQAVALVTAYETYRAGRIDEIALAFLHHDLDSLKIVNEKRRRKLAYWDEIVQVPTITTLTRGGLNPKDARFLHDAYRKSALHLLAIFERLRSFYTPELHQIYNRYKHGYTIVDPAASSLRLRPTDGRLESLSGAVAHGFAVMHASRSGVTTLNIVKSDLTEIRATLQAAAEAAELCRVFADAWLNRVEHRDGRTLVVTVVDDQNDRLARLLKKWVRPGLDPSFPLDDMIEFTLAVSPSIKRRTARTLSRLTGRGGP